MAYEQGNPYLPPQRPTYKQHPPPQHGHAEYYEQYPEQYAQPSYQSYPQQPHQQQQYPIASRGPSRAAGGQPPYNANEYGIGRGGGGGGIRHHPGEIRSHSSHSHRRPPPDGWHDPNAALEDGMRRMNVGPPGPPGANRGPPPVRPVLEGAAPGSMRPFPGDMRMGGGQRMGARGPPPPIRWNGGRGGRGGGIPQQGMPPSSRGGFQHGREPPHMSPPQRTSPGRPQIRGNATGGYEYGWTDDVDYRQYENYHQPDQRSMTMPSNISQPQYTAYNPSRPNVPTPAPHAPPEIYNPPRRIPSSETQHARESVGELLDSYFEGSDHIDQKTDPSRHPEIPRGGAHAETSPNFSRPVAASQLPYDANDYVIDRGSGGGGRGGFAQQAYHSRSQPNLRGEYSAGSPYDGIVEMPGDAPPMPRQNGFQSLSQYNGSSVVGSVKTSPPQPGSMPNRRPSAPDSLPVHPSPSQLRESEMAITRHSNDSDLPRHPPPIRPGLLQENGGHPPPIRQYERERGAVVNHHSPVEEGPVTVKELELLHSAVKMNPSDPKLQLILAKKMAEAAMVLADEGGRADAKTTRKNRENYLLEAHKIVKRLTNSAYPEAMFYFASCYGEGQLGLQVDHEKAFNLYQSAAKLNHAPSAYRTAVCCELGAGVRKDPVRSMTWYKKAASLGETPAMFKLGMILWKGLLGQPQNPRDGLIWLKRAADKADENNQHALHELGLLYESEGNDVVIPDINYARELFMRAADLGYPSSQFRLGCAYEYGNLGCPIDPRKSITWYSKAAMKGDLESQLALSGWYLTGSEGVIQQSDTEAYLWARKAAERGLAKAEYALGYYTEVGIGVPANLEEAKRWYYKAATQQHPKAQSRLQELKKGGIAVQHSRERLSRSNVKSKDQGDCRVM